MILSFFAHAVVAFPLTVLACIILSQKTGAKSAGPPPQIPPGLDLDAFRAKVAGVESERRGRG